MRKKSRIKPLLALIEEIWQENPDLRLFQLLDNCFDTNDDHYFIEDNELELRLQKCYQEDLVHKPKKLARLRKNITSSLNVVDKRFNNPCEPSGY